MSSLLATITMLLFAQSPTATPSPTPTPTPTALPQPDTTAPTLTFARPTLQDMVAARNAGQFPASSAAVWFISSVSVVNGAVTVSETTRSVTISGTASDNVGLSWLSWKNSATGESGTYVLGGPNPAQGITWWGNLRGATWWSVTVPVRLGTNPVTITLADTSVNKSYTEVRATTYPDPEKAPGVRETITDGPEGTCKWLKRYKYRQVGTWTEVLRESWKDGISGGGLATADSGFIEGFLAVTDNRIDDVAGSMSAGATGGIRIWLYCVGPHLELDRVIVESANPRFTTNAHVRGGSQFGWALAAGAIIVSSSAGTDGSPGLDAKAVGGTVHGTGHPGRVTVEGETFAPAVENGPDANGGETHHTTTANSRTLASKRGSTTVVTISGSLAMQGYAKRVERGPTPDGTVITAESMVTFSQTNVEIDCVCTKCGAYRQWSSVGFISRGIDRDQNVQVSDLREENWGTTIPHVRR